MMKRNLLVMCLTVLLSACGFQLRQDIVLPPGLATLRVDVADPYGPLQRNLAQVLGRRRAFAIAFGMAMAVGIGVGASFLLGGKVGAVTAVLGLAGLAAIGQGVAGPRRLWGGMLVAAVLWTTAWALGTG